MLREHRMRSLVGFALNVVDPDEAQKIFEYLKQMDDLAEIQEGPA